MEKQLIFEKIAEVMSELAPIAKERKNTQQGYNFRGIDDLMNAISPLVTKHGIFPATQSISDVLHESVTSKGGGAGTHLIRRYTFRFFAKDGSFVDTITDGEAIDYGDKASNKAYSVAYREAMFKMFVIPFANEDIEEANHDLVPQKPVERTPARPAAKPAAPATKPQPPKSIEQQRLAKKKLIAKLCNEIALMELETAEEYAHYVLEVTGLSLEEHNYDAIITQLQALPKNN